MKNRLIKIIASCVMMVMGAMSFVPMPVLAADDDGCVETAILGEDGCVRDDGKGSSVIGVLELVVRIMSVGIGILAVGGIVFVGIQYLTAGGNEEQTRKAKRRLFEIVIGIVAYVLMIAIMNWLIPNFSLFGIGVHASIISNI